MDLGRIVRNRADNNALAAPPWYTPLPDILTRQRNVPPARLYAALRQVAEAQPRTALDAAYDERLQAHYVVRRAVLPLSDRVAMQVTPASEIILWSRSVHGAFDFAVHRKRLVAWLTALDTHLGDSKTAPN
jgi:hypothetical protein